MSQTPLGLNSVNPSGSLRPTKVDAAGVLQSTSGGLNPVYNITAATVIKAAPGRISKIVVLVAGTGTGTVNDCLTTGAAAAANEVAVIPETVGPITLDWPCATGIVVVPGTGQTLAVSYT